MDQADAESTVPVPVPQVNNVVATGKYVGCELDLKVVSRKAENVKYNVDKKGLPGIDWCLRPDNVTVKLFASGSVQSTGAKSESQAKLAMKNVAIRLDRMGFSGVKLKGFKVHNMVASCDLKFPVRLDSFAQEYHLFASYNPEVYAAVSFRMLEPKVTISVFRTGKLTLTGAKCAADIQQAMANIHPLLVPHRLPTAAAAGPAASTAAAGPAADSAVAPPEAAAAAAAAATSAAAPSGAVDVFQAPPPSPTVSGFSGLSGS